MAEGVLMPKAGITVESCIITKWYKQKGDTVAVGDALFGFETDKSSFDCESTAAGEILEIFYQDGDEVPVLVNVCAIGTAGEDISGLRPGGVAAESAGEAPATEPAEEAPAADAPASEAPAAAVSVPVTSGKLKISPRARHLAEERGVDARMAAGSGPEGRVIERDIRELLANGAAFTPAAFAVGTAEKPGAFTGTGIGGRVTTADLQAPVSAQTAPVEEGSAYVDKKLSGIRKTIAKAMVNSLSTMAQLTNNHSFDMTDIMAFRARLKTDAEKLGIGNITINDIILFAVSRVLPRFENINANLFDDTLRTFRHVNLGVAVDTERGLIVPTIFNADQKSLHEISKEAKELAKKAQAGTLSPDLMCDGSFTVTNLGMLGVEGFTPVINPPQTGILGVNTIVTRVREKNGKIETYPSMTLSFTYDHRVVDGAPAARFVKALTEILENFTYYLAVNGGL